MKKRIVHLMVFILGFVPIFSHAEKEDDIVDRNTLSGHITDAETGEELIGATVYVKEIKSGTTTNVYGFYSISLKPGTYSIVYSYMGYESIEKAVDLEKNNQKINLELAPKHVTMQTVVIKGKAADENVTKNEMSVVKMNVETIEKIPALMGEVDVIKAIQLLPGVSSAGEGSTGFSVRGGGTDQNLILLDEATVYNGSHLMGFFSVFNHDIVKDVKLYKGDIPARFGGRLSSLLDIRQKEGNMKKFSGKGGIGTISSRLTLETPIVKDKASIVVAGRRSYADLFLPLSNNEDLHNNQLYFWDLNGKINYKINDNNRLFLSRYEGRDVMGIEGQEEEEPDVGLSFGNTTITLRWNHLFNDKLFSNYTYVRSHYDYLFDLDDPEGLVGFDWTSDMRENSLKADFGYFLNPKNTIRFGGSATLHDFEPGAFKPDDQESIFIDIDIPESKALSYSFYASNEQKIGPLLTIDYGLRFSIFQSMGKSTVFEFDKSDPFEYEVIDTMNYDKGDVYNTYTGFEPRVGLTYKLNEFSSIKASYARTYQYVHLASNANVGTPLDVWLPSSPNIKPQEADQYAIGYFRNFMDNMLEGSIELYYKDMRNQIDFKDHAWITGNPKIEGEMRFGGATAYGLEFLLRKQQGKLTGFLSYTYSFAEREVDAINKGKPYTPPYNKPHEVSVIASYELSKKLDLAATWVYSTGTPVTFPAGGYKYNNQWIPYFTKRNTYRMPDYHRLDLSCTWELGKIREEKFWHHNLVFSIYNAYNRHNAFSIEFEEQEDGDRKAIKTYLFPVVPAVTYNFNF